MGVELAYTDAVAAPPTALYAKVAKVIPEIEWPVHAPLIAEINRLKREKNAVILGHNYMTPEIFHCVSDFVGDSLALAREAARTDAKVIVQAGVHFMAETSKILSPDKTVLIPDTRAGCSLAASITGADVRLLRQKYPGLPVVTYVNTSAEVKAESDICCTSGNAVQVVEAHRPRIRHRHGDHDPGQVSGPAMSRPRPASKSSPGKAPAKCMSASPPQEIRDYRAANPGITVLAHPECPPEVVAEADFAGSTAAMIGYVGKHHPAPRGDDHRMLDERQCRRRISRRGIRAALQSLPAHEAHHAGRHPAFASDHDHRSDGRSGRSRRARGSPSTACWR